jgi:hypothetical protein
MTGYPKANTQATETLDRAKDMIDQMLLCIYGPKCGCFDRELRRRMTDAARIPLYMMLGPVTPEELKHFHDVAGEGNSKMGITEWIIDRRIDRILRPKRQTPVEMVTELIDAYRGGVAKDLAEKIIEELEAHHE